MFENVLTATQRQFLLDLLSKEAADDLLISAAQQAIEMRKNVRVDMGEIARARGTSSIALHNPPKNPADAEQGLADAKQELPKQAEPVASLEHIPPGDPAGRISAESLNGIKAFLKKAGKGDAKEINQYINGKQSNTIRLLKLLWTRKQIGWDGKHYTNI